MMIKILNFLFVFTYIDHAYDILANADLPDPEPVAASGSRTREKYHDHVVFGRRWHTIHYRVVCGEKYRTSGQVVTTDRGGAYAYSSKRHFLHGTGPTRGGQLHLLHVSMQRRHIQDHDQGPA